MPDIVQVEVSTKCQLNCLMCPLSAFKDVWTGKNMEMDVFLSIPFKRFRYAHLQGWGEPLLNPSIGDMIELASKYCSVGLTTNGLLIEKHIDTLLKTDLVAVSVGGGKASVHEDVRKSSLEKILNGIKTLSEQRVNKRPRIVIPTLMLRNTIKSLPQLIDLAHQHGADEVIANNFDYIPTRHHARFRVFGTKASPEVEEAISEAEKRAEELGIGFTARPRVMEEALVCAENPVNNCLVTVDGKIAPCVYLHLPTSSDYISRYFEGREFLVPKVYFGTVQDFDRVWGNRNYRTFRRMFERRLSLLRQFFSFSPSPLPDVCKTCYKAYSV
ncbi:radical SAM/SPASM domain-containing protein [Archaeoglobus neptunius]|uniref:radical SAM/SPASM domain-containing protein n=1 Tax=Archaeoglobus neptunius TaxID=2798580 RepID=UPI00192704A2|nr:radical SAM/SPASM domain-containing protein [Archaeoglobus neptunius]